MPARFQEVLGALSLSSEVCVWDLPCPRRRRRRRRRRHRRRRHRRRKQKHGALSRSLRHAPGLSPLRSEASARQWKESGGGSVALRLCLPPLLLLLLLGLSFSQTRYSSTRAAAASGGRQMFRISFSLSLSASFLSPLSSPTEKENLLTRDTTTAGWVGPTTGRLDRWRERGVFPRPRTVVVEKAASGVGGELGWQEGFANVTFAKGSSVVFSLFSSVTEQDSVVPLCCLE